MSLVPTFSSPLEFDMLLQEPVHSMMETGILIDKDKQAEHQAEVLQEWDDCQTTLNELVGKSINVSSTKQVPWLLYDELGLQKKTKKDRRTGKVTIRADEEAIRLLMAESKYKVDNLKTESARQAYMRAYVCCYYIIKIRGLRKQLSSYLGISIKRGKFDGFSKLTDEDGRVRGTISVGGTETARFSHSKTLWGTGVNLATVPRKLRSMYIADDDYEFVELDLNRGESWVYAHLSEDPELLRIHTLGLDFHAETAAAISVAYDKPLTVDWILQHKDDDGPDGDLAFKIRYLGKRNNHATSYRMGFFKGAEIINQEAEETGITVTPSQVKKAQGLWHMKYFCVRDKWWKEIEKQIADSRTMVTPYGRVHTFHGHINDELYKSATAYVPQSTSVDYLNRGFLKAYHLYQKTSTWDLRILTQTHDSMLAMYKRQYRDEAIPALAEALVSKLTIKGRTFSIPVEAKYGPNWGTDMKPYKLAA